MEASPRKRVALLHGVCCLGIVWLCLGITGCQTPNGSIEVEKDYVIEQLNDAVIVDVRTATEYSEGHITHAINIDSSSLQREEEDECRIAPAAADAAFAQVGASKNDTLILYGQTSQQADEVAEALWRAGYASIAVYSDGYEGWRGTLKTPCAAAEEQSANKKED